MFPCDIVAMMMMTNICYTVTPTEDGEKIPDGGWACMEKNGIALPVVLLETIFSSPTVAVMKRKVQVYFEDYQTVLLLL